jgi:DNA polymerase-3 subunit delta
MLKKELLPEGLDSFNLSVLEGKGLTIEALRDAVETLPLMSERRLVLVSDFDFAKAGAAMRTALEEYLSNPLPDTACLVFVQDILPYKPDGRTKLGDALKKTACIVEFDIQESAHLAAWLKRHFEAAGKRIDPDTAEYLIFICGGSMTSLKNEVEKLSAYAKGGWVTKEDVDKLVLPVLEARVFELTGAVAEGKTRKAASVLLDLEQLREEPLMTLGALGRQIRGIYAARLALERGKGVKEIMEIMGYRSKYPAGLLLESARKRSLAWCRRAVSLCYEADIALKSQSRGRERVLELLLAELH